MKNIKLLEDCSDAAIMEHFKPILLEEGFKEIGVKLLGIAPSISDKDIRHFFNLAAIVNLYAKAFEKAGILITKKDIKHLDSIVDSVTVYLGYEEAKRNETVIMLVTALTNLFSQLAQGLHAYVMLCVTTDSFIVSKKSIEDVLMSSKKTGGANHKELNEFILSMATKLKDFDEILDVLNRKAEISENLEEEVVTATAIGISAGLLVKLLRWYYVSHYDPKESIIRDIGTVITTVKSDITESALWWKEIGTKLTKVFKISGNKAEIEANNTVRKIKAKHGDELI